MRDRLACEFFLIRYVPDVVKGEFVNIGVLLREAEDAVRGESSGGAQVRFTRNWSRVRCLDAGVDVELLEALEGEVAGRLRESQSGRDAKSVVKVLEDTLSNSVQMTEARGTLAESMAAEMDLLMGMYVEPIKVARVREKEGRASGRAGIAGAMRTEFERAGVWGAMRKRIAAAIYTQAGDPLKIDCGYRAGAAGPSGVIRLFQAVSLEGDVEMAKGLAYTASQMREGVRRVEGADLELTAVVEPLRAIAQEGDEAGERYRFGLDAMERGKIRVVTLSDLARAAETARRELGM